MLPYDQLLAMLGKMRFKDDTALRTIGLARLSKTYDAYPVTDEGKRLYCLLPKGAEVPTARKLTPQTALGGIIVLHAELTGVAKVWPHEGSAQSVSALAPAAASLSVSKLAAKIPAAKPVEPKPDASLGSLEFVDE